MLILSQFKSIDLRRALFASLPLLVGLATACDGGESSTETQLRSLPAPVEELDVYISLELAGGEDGDGPIWEILKYSPTAGPVAVSDGPASSGDLLLELDGEDIYDRLANQTCTIGATDPASGARELLNAAGTQVLLTSWSNYVIDGEVTNFGSFNPATDSRVLYIFDDTDVYQGDATNATLLLVADVDLDTATDYDRLVIAALAEGLCM